MPRRRLPTRADPAPGTHRPACRRPPRAAHAGGASPGKPPRHLADLTPQERADAVAALGEKPFRARQLSVHYFDRLVEDPAAMTDLPAAARERLVADLLPTLATPVRSLDCDGGTTVKTVWRLFDGALVESVLMRYPDRVTVCVSSQAGCGMNCPFCATGQAGLTRNLSTAEIVEQVVAAGRGPAHRPSAGRAPGARGPGRQRGVHGDGGAAGQLQGRGGRRPAADGTRPRPASASPRAASPSRPSAWCRRSSGWPPRSLPVTLALSLHAPDDELRDELVPINTRFTVAQALDAARAYAATTGRRVSIEYALIRDVNDHAWRADLLGRELARRGSGWVHVNPIPLNPTPGVAVDGQRPARPGRVRRPAAGARHPRHGARHPRPRDRRGLRAAGRRDLTS